MTHTTRRAALGLALLASPLALPVAAQTTAPGRPGSAEHAAWLAHTVQRLADQDAIRAIAGYYGRGNDMLGLHHADRARGRQLAAVEYARAFAADVQIDVFAVGGPTPIGSTRGIPAWIDFAGGFYANAGYSSTLHPMANFHIEFTDANTARMSAFAGAPHFVLAAAREAGAAAPSLDFMVCRYEFEARRQPDGSWKATRLRINLDEIWRASGFYPNGQAPGR
jgi:hypothetical protein